VRAMIEDIFKADGLPPLNVPFVKSRYHPEAGAIWSRFDTLLTDHIEIHQDTALVVAWIIRDYNAPLTQWFLRELDDTLADSDRLKALRRVYDVPKQVIRPWGDEESACILITIPPLTRSV